jgi:energy-coupling factor transporter ATP-binding protein EcfA2
VLNDKKPLMKRYKVTDVFTPTSQAKLTFVERENSINDELVEALMTPGKQIIIYGQSGSGKSTLITNKLDQTYEGVIISRCTSSTKFEELVLDAFDQLNPFYTESQTKSTSYFIGANIKASYGLIQNQIQANYSKASTDKLDRLLPPQLTAQRLAEFLGVVKSCWVVEDFHKLEETEKVKFSQNMKVFFDSATNYPEVKMIAVGAVGTARDVINYDSEMNNRVSEIFVSTLDQNELHTILDKGEELLNIEIGQSNKNRIVSFTNGLGAICHQLALNLCFTKGIHQTCDNVVKFDSNDLKLALEKYVQSNSDTLKGRFEKATMVQRKGIYNNGQEILIAMSQIKDENTSYGELLEKIRENNPKYPPGNLTQYLQKLQDIDRGSVIVKNKDYNTYSFSDPFIKTYVQCMFESKQKKDEDPKEMERQIKAVFDKLVDQFMKSK